LEQQVAMRTEQLRASMATLERTHDRLEEAQAIGRIGDIEIDLATQKRVWSDQVFLLYSFPKTAEPPPIEQVLASVHPTDQPAFRRFLDSYTDQPDSATVIVINSDAENSLEYRIIRHDGSIIWLLMTARAGERPDDKARILRITVQDITRRKILERELLATINREQELSRLKTSFLQMITHEYRTPLGIITSSAQILERYFDRLSEEERLDHLQGIQSSARRLANLLEDVLFLGKTDSGLVILQPGAIELEAWLQTVSSEVIASLGAERMVNVTVELALDRVLLDERLLRHVMNNLISNALKYSTLDQSVSVSARSDGNWIELSVRDRGIGIPAADAKKLFQMFQRASNVGTISGRGLGLVIVKRCVDLHHGTVEIRNAPERGTEVIVRLPKSPPAVQNNL
jgi:signal transduction histidine kinase